MILHFTAIALAVTMLSPVTIRTVTPAPLTFVIASGTSYLTISMIPKMQIRVKPLFSTSLIS